MAELSVKNHPSLPILCRSDGAVQVAGRDWTFGSLMTTGYRCISFRGKIYRVHRLILETFVGVAPEDKPFVDHINRIRDDNRPENLRWVDRSENRTNAIDVDQSIAIYGVRECEDRAAYRRGVYKCNEASRQSQIARVRRWQREHRDRVNAAARARYARKHAKKEAR